MSFFSSIAHAVGSVASGVVNTVAAPARIVADAVQGKNVGQSIQTNVGRAVAGTAAIITEPTKLVAAPLRGTFADRLTGGAFTGAAQTADSFRASQNTGQISNEELLTAARSYGTIGAVGYGASAAYTAIRGMGAVALAKAGVGAVLSSRGQEAAQVGEQAADAPPDTGTPIYPRGEGMTAASPRPLGKLPASGGAQATAADSNTPLLAAAAVAALLL